MKDNLHGSCGFMIGFFVRCFHDNGLQFVGICLLVYDVAMVVISHDDNISSNEMLQFLFWNTMIFAYVWLDLIYDTPNKYHGLWICYKIFCHHELVSRFLNRFDMLYCTTDFTILNGDLLLEINFIGFPTWNVMSCIYDKNPDWFF